MHLPSPSSSVYSIKSCPQGKSLSSLARLTVPHPFFPRGTRRLMLFSIAFFFFTGSYFSPSLFTSLWAWLCVSLPSRLIPVQAVIPSFSRSSFPFQIGLSPECALSFPWRFLSPEASIFFGRFPYVFSWTTGVKPADGAGLDDCYLH